MKIAAIVISLMSLPVSFWSIIISRRTIRQSKETMKRLQR